MDKEREEELKLNFDSGDGTDDLRLARQELEEDLAAENVPEEAAGAVPAERPGEEVPEGSDVPVADDQGNPAPPAEAPGGGDTNNGGE